MKQFFFEAYFDKLGRTQILDSIPDLTQYNDEVKMLRFSAKDIKTAELMVKQEYPSVRFLLLQEVR